MSTRAGFAEIDITPPPGTVKVGWIKEIIGHEVLDPLYAHVAIFEGGDEAVAFIQLDTLLITAEDVRTIREELTSRFGFPGDHVMVAATHNHAGPAVATCGDARRDEPYVEKLIEKIVQAFAEARDNLEDAEIGFGSCFEFNVSHNRRVVMRDGTVRTHGNFNDPEALYIEGPVDPEVAVVAARNKKGELLGAIVNFACHPTHHGPEPVFSAGFPGVVARTLKERSCPVSLYLTGSCGNLHTANPACRGRDASMEDAGGKIAEDALGVIDGMTFRDSLRLGAASRTIMLPYREVTQDEIQGTTRGAQRFVNPDIYDRHIPSLVEHIKKESAHPTEVQVLFMDEYAFVSQPAELFVQLGLRIKEAAHPRHGLVVGYANGHLGYIPHKEAFARGGYETTFCWSSCFAHEAGDMLVACAAELLQAHDARD